MSIPAIRISGLSKAYRIGLKQFQHDTLSSSMLSWIKSPARNYRKLRSLSNINSDSNDADLHWALKDINIEIGKGEVVGIVGKNGAGKSTLLKIISQITYPTTGSIQIFGRVASLLEVGTGFNPELTGRENVYLNGTILGMTRKEIVRKFDEIVAFSGVEKFIDTPVKRYSSGMKVRLAFAVAAHLDPEILIIDEVLAVGDTEFQRKCLGKIQDVSQKEGRTVLFVSHNLAMIQSLCEAGLLLVNGRKQEYGKIQTVLELYKKDLFSNSYVNDHSGSPIALRSIQINGSQSDFVIEDTDVDISIEVDSKIACTASLYFIIQNEEGFNVVHTRNDNVLLTSSINRFRITYPALPVRPGLYSFHIKIIYNSDGVIERFTSDTYYMKFSSAHNLSDLNALLAPKYCLQKQ